MSSTYQMALCPTEKCSKFLQKYTSHKKKNKWAYHNISASAPKLTETTYFLQPFDLANTAHVIS